MMESRICTWLPTPAIEKLQEDGQLAPQQLSRIIETFYWDALPTQFDNSYQLDLRQRITIYVTDRANTKLRRYTQNNRKTITSTIVHALVALGKYNQPN